MGSETGAGREVLEEMSEAPRFTDWTFDLVGKHIRGTVLEVGSGIGNNVARLVALADRVVATDIEPGYVELLAERFRSAPVEVRQWDVTRGRLAGCSADVVFCSNVLEHIVEERSALESMRESLAAEGTLVLIVPQGRWLFSSLDESVEHVRRYDEDRLRQLANELGFSVTSLFSFNRAAVLGWLWRGRIRGKRTLGRGNMRLYNRLVPLLRAVDRLLPWRGLSLCLIASRSASDPVAPRK